MATIYVVEDDNDILEIETFALKNSNYEVKGFTNAKDFYAAVEDKVPSLAVLDVMLPDEDGLQIVQKLRHNPRAAHIPIIMVTARTTEIDKVKGLDIGADDYMTKPFGVMELISRVKALLRRSGRTHSSPVLTFQNIKMEEDKHFVSVNEKPCELTFKEYELLKLLLTNAGIVVGRDTILEKVWGTDFEGESRTLDMHIKTLRKKLGDAGAYIKTVRNVGYILTGEE